jgi:hypothetical protein
VTPSRYFEQVVVVDFEYEIEDGGLPNVLCMVAHLLNANLQHIRTIKLWGVSLVGHRLLILNQIPYSLLIPPGPK